MTPDSPYARKLAAIAQDQFDRFHLLDESDPPLAAQIDEYWTALGLPFPGVETAWSAVFVSYCVKAAGTTAAEFEFSIAHSVFVHRAIQNELSRTGVFRGVPITADAVRIGDIIQNNREGNHFDYDFARDNPRYISHSAIVVLLGEDAQGRFALTVGGNEDDSVRTKRVDLNDDGSIRQRAAQPFICLVKNLK